MHKQIENLSIEQMREIVSGAPIECAYYGLVNNIVIYYQWSEEWFWYNPNTNEYERDFSKSMRFSLNDLRTAIAEHDSAQLCIGCGSPDLHKGGEIKEPKMCLDCFAEMVGFTRTSNGFVESDDVTDIRNHLSPSTVVWDLASGEDLTAEAERHG